MLRGRFRVSSLQGEGHKKTDKFVRTEQELKGLNTFNINTFDLNNLDKKNTPTYSFRLQK